MKALKLVDVIRNIRTDRIKAGDIQPWLTVSLHADDLRDILADLRKLEHNDISMELMELERRQSVYGVSVNECSSSQVPLGMIHVYSVRTKQLIAEVSFSAGLDHPDYFKG